MKEKNDYFKKLMQWTSLLLLIPALVICFELYTSGNYLLFMSIVFMLLIMIITNVYPLVKSFLAKKDIM